VAGVNGNGQVDHHGEPTLDLSVVLPCYNERVVIEESTAEIVRVLEATRLSWEIIFVDDVSKDDTVARAERLCAADDRLRLIRHAQNTGRGRTATDGLRAARGKVAGFLDIDLEVPARYIPPAVQAIHTGADVVCAWRIYLPNLPLLHREIARQLRRFRPEARRLREERRRDATAGGNGFRAATIDDRSAWIEPAPSLSTTGTSGEPTPR
jgi:glycosyltransferase involved in cell wall biosynthesis